MNKFVWAVAMSAAAMAQPALAAPTPPKPTIIYTPGSYAVPSWTTAKIFENFQSASTVGTYKPVKNEAISGPVDADSGISFGNGLSASANKYLEISAGGMYKVTFPQAEQYFSFSLHDLASSDKVTLSFANGSSLALTGTQIVGSTITNKASLLGTSGRVNYDLHGQSGVVSALFSTSANCPSFMIDDLASAAPEASTWAMMILGFGIVGVAIRRAHRRSEEKFDAKIRRIAAGSIA